MADTDTDTDAARVALPTSTRAVVTTGYGGPEMLGIGERPVPPLEADQVLVRVHAGSLNALDWHRLRGEPYMMRLGEGLRRLKDAEYFGADLAGVVTAVGTDVADLAAGTRVFGQRTGSLADHVVVKREGVAALPDSVSFAEGSCLGVAALTAIQAIRTHGFTKSGDHVLVTGAGGGVGTFAVQIAKADGAHVTAMTSAPKAALVAELGADRVVGYDELAGTPQRYDVIADCAGWHPIRKLRRVLAADGRLTVVGLGTKNPWALPFGRFAQAPVVRLTSRQRVIPFVAKRNQPDLLAIGELVGSGAVRVPIERVYPLAELAEAMTRLESRATLGKLVVTLT